MEPIAKLKELPRSSPKRPGRVQKLMGIIFQSDQKSVLGSWIIRPVEMLDRRLAGLGRSPDNPALAMHVGIHVLIFFGPPAFWRLHGSIGFIGDMGLIPDIGSIGFLVNCLVKLAAISRHRTLMSPI